MSPKITNILVVLILLGLSLALLANSMTKPLGRDEQMYCTGGALLAKGKMPYRDFSYPSQMPYHPLLYAALFRILNTTYYLLVGRILSVLCNILVMVCIVSIYRHIFGTYAISGMLLGLAGSILYVFNPLVDYANGYAWNHDVVIACVVLSFRLFASADFKQKANYRRIAIIGALLTLATCMRITTVLVELLFFAVLLAIDAESIKQRLKTILSFLIAGGIVLIWPIWLIAQAPQAFFLNLYWIPKLYGEWLNQIGLVHNKVELILDSITKPGYLVLIVIAIYICLAIVWQRRKLPITSKRNLLLAALLVLAFFIIALIPPTMWRQYLAMPVPFLIISLAYPLFYLRSSQLDVRCSVFRISCTILAICTVVAVASHPVVLYRTSMLLVPEGWVPIRLHRTSEEIAQKTNEPKLILTLAPLFAVEGGCNIYPELSAGPIVYRIADHLSAWNRDITHTVGPRTLKKLIEKKPPSAVILSVEPKYFSFLEEPLFQTAVKPEQEKWERQVYEDGPTVYFRR